MGNRRAAGGGGAGLHRASRSIQGEAVPGKKKENVLPIGSVSVPLFAMLLFIYIAVKIVNNGEVFGVPMTLKSLGFQDSRGDVRA